ncbi:alpha/beta-hydrolase [Pseudovirgaria hyperparasitica]|uniref:triacylglycerol lipase n=1 Tax=Pseudovirgaria hyperparasitica TaxID=470096 RepID=A0A6A6WEX8_9PEZI|nr:alpha/beta-hydrolase [Pseudovirgaria hyperparasitica]KAF2761372.1 alpha/beta-hydrolase [Pseudovirgaria hyperparasitica]
MSTMRTQHHDCASAGRVTARLLLSFLVLSPVSKAERSHQDVQLPVIEPQIPLPPQSTDHDFTLRHIFHHGTYQHPGLHRRLDIPPEASLLVTYDDDTTKHYTAPKSLKARAAPLKIQRLADRTRSTIDSMLETSRMTGKAADLPISAWVEDEIKGPNVTDQETVLSFARMAADAYVITPSQSDWLPVGGGFNYTEDFGWETDGLRGHIFADTDNRTVVIGLKGTSPAMFDGAETTTNDKINDNLFFSCCCGQGGQFMWKRVCDCQMDTYQCNSTCLTKSLRAKNRYYYAAQDLYHNVTALYPNADVWLSGHSLGGAVSSMLGLTFGLPVVSFEAVPEAMPAARLGLPVPPGDTVGSMSARASTGGFHFGHTADPIYMGLCNSASSICTIAGYAMQSVCHTGSKCVYDTVKDFGWRVGIGSHKIVSVISDVIEKYEAPPKCQQYSNCSDCFLWDYYESNGTETTTTRLPITTSSSYTRTRTTTCKTPGWWGCLDESTTEDSTTTTTSSSSTSTCRTPGWFGCLDETSTTTTTSISSSSGSAAPAPTVTTTSISEPTATSSCATPGWFGGCLDPWPSITSMPAKLTSRPTTLPAATSCTSSKWFGIVCADVKGQSHEEI